jgi:hypothetical protein
MPVLSAGPYKPIQRHLIAEYCEERQLGCNRAVPIGTQTEIANLFGPFAAAGSLVTVIIAPLRLTGFAFGRQE